VAAGTTLSIALQHIPKWRLLVDSGGEPGGTCLHADFADFLQNTVLSKQK
jgi:hypothetical protein